MLSKEHKLYLKKLKFNKFLVNIVRMSIIILFIVAWQLLVDLNILNDFIFSSPVNIIKTFISLIKSNNLIKHVNITLYETIISFLLATFIGIFIASILWLNNFLAKIVDPFLTILNSLPKVSLGPIIIIWFGANTKSIIVMALSISLITSIISIYQSFKEVPNNKITLMRSLGANKRQIFFRLILPANYSNIINILKINISMSLIGVIMGELLVSKEGIGYLIMYGSQVFNLNLVFTGIIVLLIVSYLMYLIVLYLEKILVKN